MTVERTIAAKLFIEHYFDRLPTSTSGASGRAKRREKIEEDLKKDEGLSEMEKGALRAAWVAAESERARRAREKVGVAAFEGVRVLGHGGFRCFDK